MGKTKKNKKQIADKVRASKSAKEKKLNPFELRINKQKHSVLGRNQNIRGQVGNPGQSRAKANKQRCKTLLVELKQSKKSNVFKDQRLGEKLSGLSQDDKAMQRFALERKIQHQQQGKHEEEGEEEELTHYGQSLAEIEKFDDIEHDSDSDEDGRLGGRVAEEHFGGFLTHKVETDKMNWKERMAELISQSKKQKYERQSEKDDVQKKTEEVDAELKAEFEELHHLLTSKKPGISEKEKGTADGYDIKARSLQFEIRGKPSDRLKTEEELAKEEAERLQKLEADRKRRMKGELSSHEAPTHISADSLDDGYSFGYSPPPKGKVSFQQSKDSDGSGDDEEKEDEKAGSSDEEKGKESDGDEDSDGDDDSDEDGEDDDDLESDEEEDEEEVEKMVESLLKKKMEEKKGGPRSILKKSKATADPEEQKKIAEAAQQEIPYTFEAPADLDGLVSLLSQYKVEDQATVVERLVACHHPSLAEGNKQKLQLLFSLLLHYLMDMMMQDHPPVQLFDQLTPMLHRLLRYDPEAGTATVTRLILDRHDEFQQICQRRSGRGRYMGLDTMLLLKLVHVLYPTSDFKHPVVTPAFYFISTMLGQAPVQSERDVAAGLYLCTLCLEYVSLSKRYIPEVVNFLHGILYLASTKNPKKGEASICVGEGIPPFKPVGNFVDLLKLKGTVTDAPVLSIVKTLATDVERQQLDTDEFRVSSISTCIQLLQEFSHLYAPLPAAMQIFAPVVDMLDKLPTDQYPQGLRECIQHLKATLEKDASCSLEALTMEKKKPQPLKLLEPRIEEVFDGRKKRKGTREQLERQRLQHKVKKEFKGALREIRKDSQFLARQHIKTILESDEERRRKVKRVYADLSSQEGECRALKRQKDWASK